MLFLIMVRIYTRTGDRGETGLIGGKRVSKAHPRIEAYGTVDELNCLLGVVLAAAQERPLPQPLEDALSYSLPRIQADLFLIGALLADPGGKGNLSVERLQVKPLEQMIDRWEEELTPLRSFILPGGSLIAAYLHLARTVCRRAERAVVALREGGEEVAEQIIVYLNRLSDLLFVLARFANHQLNIEDQPWLPQKEDR